MRGVCIWLRIVFVFGHELRLCEPLLNVGYTWVVGQPLKHLANEAINGVMTHIVSLNDAIRCLESWNVTIQ